MPAGYSLVQCLSDPSHERSMVGHKSYSLDVSSWRDPSNVGGDIPDYLARVKPTPPMLCTMHALLQFKGYIQFRTLRARDVQRRRDPARLRSRISSTVRENIRQLPVVWADIDHRGADEGGKCGLLPLSLCGIRRYRAYTLASEYALHCLKRS